MGDPSPWDAGTALQEWIAARSAALSSHSDAVAVALGYSQPLRWREECREIWRTELDAAMFHVYGYSRDDVLYSMESFAIVAKNDRRMEGLRYDDLNWRTKRLILGKYDELAHHSGAGRPYVSPAPPPPLPNGLRLSADDAT